MQEIYNDGTDQEVYFDAVDISSGEQAIRLVGSTDGELMTGAAVAFKEYKVATAAISSSVISWVQALGKWKLIIPYGNITQYGYGLIFITKTGLAPVTIELKTVHEDSYFAGSGAITSLSTQISGVSDTALNIKEITDLLTLPNINTELTTAIQDSATVAQIFENQTTIQNLISGARLVTDLLTLAAINAEVDTAIVDSLTATPLDAIKAQAFLALTDYDTAIPLAKTSEITALNNLSLGDVGTALATYTAPTMAELTLAVLPLSTAEALSTAQGGITAIQAVTDTVAGEFDTTQAAIAGIALTESVGADKIVPAAYYTIDASENTITLTSPYNVVTVEQIKNIFNLTQGSEIYNCLNPRKRRLFLTAPDNVGIDITVGSGATAGVITYIEDSDMTDDDKIQIVVNMP